MKTGFVLFVMMIALGLPSAQASEATATGVSVGSASFSQLEAIREKLSLSYFGTFHGAPVNDLSSPYGVDHSGKQSTRNAILFDSDVSAAYKITRAIGVGPYVPFLYAPVLGQGFILGDVGIKAYNKKTLSMGGFNLYTNLILQAPTSDGSRNRGMDFSVKTTPSVRYQFSDSRFAVGSWTEAKAYLGVTKDKSFKLWAGPYVSYQLSRSLALNLEYEMETDHLVGNPAFDFTSYQTDLMPGVIWNINSQFMVNPYLQLFTGNKVTADTTAVGAVISASLL